MRAVTDDDAAAAAAAAAEEAARETRTAGPASMPGIPLEEIVQAVVGASQRVLGEDWEARLATMISALRHRLAGDYAVDEFGFDPQITEILTSAVEPLAETWFRLEVRGAENIPAEGGALLVANHSGTVPIDGIITGYAVKKYGGRDLRPLGADLVFALPFIGQMARKVGATLACTEDAERLLASGEVAGVWPEGFKGIGKPFAERYKLQRFGRGGFVSSAMRAQVPIVPVSIVGAEEIYPLIGNVPSLARLLGLPYLPVTPFFPLLGPLGLVPLPSKWIIEFGEPIRTDAYEPDQADDPMLLFNVTDQVRETIQQTLYALLVDRGSPFF
ncbi:lysophospholipid acyltransferase family protein [Aeromicrobium halocynthiae]|uniref:Lysophospholipid acyltransferase family protein n=1 Tax=Aeromicrobium halocynthiae TaxID=560557 RepID=A0ABN2VXH5_9ACTN